MCIYVSCDLWQFYVTRFKQTGKRAYFMINDDNIYITDNNSYRDIHSKDEQRALKKVLKSITNGTIQREYETDSKPGITHKRISLDE